MNFFPFFSPSLLSPLYKSWFVTGSPSPTNSWTSLSLLPLLKEARNRLILGRWYHSRHCSLLTPSYRPPTIPLPPPTLRRLLLTPLPLFLPYFLFRSIPAFERKNIIYIYFWNSVFIIIIAEQKNSIFYKIIPFRIFKFSFPLQWDIYYRVLNPFTFKFLCWTESEEIVKRELSPSVKKLRGWFINGKLKKNRELIHIYITKIIIYNIY